jgi:hypothetical protein
MRKLTGYCFASFLLAFPIAALVFLAACLWTFANAATLPPMPMNCTTPQTMDAWYSKVAKQNLLISHNPADCKAQLVSLGATPSTAGRECSK